jgi:hypothetical protein
MGEVGRTGGVRGAAGWHRGGGHRGWRVERWGRGGGGDAGKIIGGAGRQEGGQRGWVRHPGRGVVKLWTTSLRPYRVVEI